MRTSVLVAAVAVGLVATGCSKKTEAPAAGESASAGTVESVKRQPGKWKADLKLVRMDIPGAPPEMKQAMEKMMAAASGQEQCITAEQADKEDIANALSQSSPGGADCTYAKKNVSGGVVDIEGTCNKNGQAVKMTIKGTASSTAQDITIVSGGMAPDGKTPMEMEMQVKATRVGDCG